MSRITIQDVAREAGVSIATVSRVLNGGENVRPETAKLVMDKIDELGYRPNLLGRHLRTNETKTILVMVSTIANTFIAKVVRSIEETGTNMGYSILICTTNDQKDRENSHLNLLRNRYADGVIILNTVMNKEEMSKLGKQHNIIQCCEYISDTGVPYVSIDNKKASYDATKYLIDSGRRKIAYMGVKNHIVSSRERYEGYIAALTDCGIKVDKDFIADGNYGFRSAIRIMNIFLSKGHKPDALFAISDRMAAGAIRSLKDKGIKIPEDIAVMGFDNTDISYISEPSITTVSQSPIELGKQAMKLMVKRIKGENVIKNVTVKHNIVIRNSTK